MRSGTGRGGGSIHWVYIANALGQVVLLITSVALLSAGGDIAALVAGFALARLAVLMMLAPIVRRAVGCVRLPIRPAFDVVSGLLKASGIMLGGTMLNVLLVPLNRWCIAATAGPAAVPVFDIGYAGSMQIRNVLEFGLRSLVPEVAGLTTLGHGDAVRKLHATWTRRVLYVGLLCYGLAGIAAPVLLHAWLRDQLLPEQVTIFRVLLFAGFFSLLGTPAYYLLIGLRRAGDVFWSYAVQAACNALLMVGAVLGGPRYVLLVAAGAIGVATLASAVLLIVRVRKTCPSRHIEDPACCPV